MSFHTALASLIRSYETHVRFPNVPKFSYMYSFGEEGVYLVTSKENIAGQRSVLGQTAFPLESNRSPHVPHPIAKRRVANAYPNLSGSRNE
ncbi:hypothetical protein AVEN_27696-1 [Araneus ventricosus]|uniref:Uncharacterized protein n=1 Tax=Araneus ventricosus TaxID=182803 RepID=A0A4Y2MH47_ARAVE|nr:hypothetical protein AVEN_27696-1 [Araneus ventricosus]